MPTFGLIVEGEYDAAALIELVRRCTAGNIEVIPRQCAQKGSLMKRFAAYLRELQWANQGQAVDKALVIRDADGKNPQELIARMETSIISRSYPFPVKFVVIVQELEAWLLADHEALSQVTQKRISAINCPLESIIDPKRRLQMRLSEAGIAYTAEVARKIAAAANLETIEYRCSSFGTFRQAVHDC
ncbi:MAG TPA: DUF4276 family protein [Alphaproteobacteria bacterium]|nr:DUF4276 family protein [Alphaproteobacteria bacterium]